MFAMRSNWIVGLSLSGALVAAAVPAAAGPVLGCDDRARCTVDDHCSDEGICVGTRRECPDDGNACTLEICRQVTGECGTLPLDCSGPCRTGSCDPLSGCAILADGTACDDGNPCTRNETCRSGLCRGELLPDGTRCVDGLGPCTVGDRCLQGGCSGDLVACPDTDGDSCTMEFCNFTSGACQPVPRTACDEQCEMGTCTGLGSGCVPRPDGTACDDGNECTVEDRCAQGVCGGRPIRADDLTPTPGVTNTPTAPVADTSTPSVESDGDGGGGGCVVRPGNAGGGSGVLVLALAGLWLAAGRSGRTARGHDAATAWGPRGRSPGHARPR